MIKISIIIPCYNVEKYIYRCAVSLFNQTIGIKYLQLIFVDDASTDNTLNILYELEKEYPDNIIIIACEENGRQGRARNIGMQHSQADYIGFIDSDDYVDVTMFEKLYTRIIEFDCDIVCCNQQIIYEGETKTEIIEGENKLIEIKTVNDRKDYIHNGIGYGGICTKIYSKRLIFDNNFLFPEKIAYEDNYWVTLLNFNANSIYYVHEYLYYYCFNTNSTVVTKNAKYHFDRLKIELMKIDYLKKNKLFNLYHDEIEFDFLVSFYFNSLYIFFTRFDETPVDMILKMNEILINIFPLYKKNIYYNEVSKVGRELLGMLSMNKEDLIKNLPYLKSICI